MACGDKVKMTCGGQQYSTCVAYEGVLADWSELDQCATIKETTQELYENISEIKDQIDLADLEADCLTLPINRSVKTILQSMLNFICSQNETISSQQISIETLQQQVEELQQQNCP